MRMRVQLGPVRSSFGDADRDAWDMWFYAGRCLDRKDSTLRAWQVKVLWLHVSVWWKSSPLAHELHSR